MKYFILIFISIFSIHIYAQNAGKSNFYFLNVPQSARAMSLGGTTAGIYDDDVNTSLQNPSMVNEQMDKKLGVNYLAYFTGVNAGYFSYGHHIKPKQNISFGLLYFNYGTFDKRDEIGASLGVYWASDYLAHASYSRQIGKKLNMGVSGKMMFSQYEKYSSAAIAGDVAISHIDTAKSFFASFIIQNIGFPIDNYTKQAGSRLPIDIQFTMSKKLEHAPFRFIFTAHDLQKWDLSYVNNNSRNQKIDLQTNEKIIEKVAFGDKLFRHFIFATEMVFTPNFNVRFGYNNQRRKEMSLPEYRGFTGFSWGFSMKLLKTNFSYANGGYFPGKGTHQLSFLIDLKPKKNKNL